MMNSVFEPFDPLTKIFLKEMRKNRGVKTYPEVPGTEVWQMRDNVYSFLAKSPGQGGDPWMHLIIGTEKAMLIDTAFGIGNVKALVEKLTDKPYFVVNTHFHGDHSLGNYQFEKVYCMKQDVPYLEMQMNPEALSRFTPEEGSFYTKEDVVKYKPYELCPMEDGDTFDLGNGYLIEVCHLPGHAPGGCGFIDKQNRILFSGDAIVSTPTLVNGKPRGTAFTDCMTVRAFRDQLEKLVPKMKDFDVLYPGHALLEYPKEAVTDMLRACTEIVNDPECYTDAAINERDGSLQKLKVVGLASIAYSDERIG